MLQKLLKRSSFSTYFGNLTIRALTIGAKFCFTFFLGKQFDEQILGEYGLFATTILLCYFVLSLSFESYGLREIIQKPVKDHLSYIRNLFTFYFISYAIFIPLSSLIFYFGLLPGRLFLYFVILLFLETLNQTFFVLFAIIQRSVVANLVLFFSQGFWIIAVFVFWFFDLIQISSLESFLIIWMGGSLIGNCYACYKLLDIYKDSVVSKVIDWKWIRNGLSVSMIFFWSTLAYKLIEFTDRYMIELKIGTAQLGIYVFYSQLANLINTVINVIVILILYPKLIENYVKQDMTAFLIIRRKMYLRVILLGTFIAAAEIIFIHPMLDFLGKSSFKEEITVFYILIGANIFMNLSFIPHYCLYAMRKDFIILYTTVLASLFNVVLNITLIPQFGIIGAAISTLTSFLSVWLSKAFFLKKNLKHLVNDTPSL